MNVSDVEKLKTKLAEEIIARDPGVKVAIVGWTVTALDIANSAALRSGGVVFLGTFAVDGTGGAHDLSELAGQHPDIVVIADDAGKEPLLEAVAILVPPQNQATDRRLRPLRVSRQAFRQCHEGNLHPFLCERLSSLPSAHLPMPQECSSPEA